MHKTKIKHVTSKASPIFDLQLYVVTLPVIKVVELELLRSRTLGQSFSKCSPQTDVSHKLITDP